MERHTISKTLGTIAVASILGLLLAACGGAKATQPPQNDVPSSAAAPAQAKGTVVGVQLGETDLTHMYMKVDKSSVPAGLMTFSVVNQGVKTHEFVVLKTNTKAGDFPIVSFEGEKDRINEDTAGDNVGETGDMAAGSTKTLSIKLKPGHYALVCNLPGHYRMGMFTDFQVS